MSAAAVLFIGLAVFLLKPLWFVNPGGSMYGNSVARVYSAGGPGFGKCVEASGSDMMNCSIELDPGSGWGADLAVWKTGSDCWKGYLQVGRRNKHRINPPNLDLPPNVFIRSPQFSGCVRFYKDFW